MFTVGETFDGWTVEAVLGSGPVGPLLRCRREGGAPVVIRVLTTPDVPRASALCLLSHPNVVRVLEVREHADHCVVVMEWVEGRPLAELIPPKLPRERLRTLGAQLAAALEHMHGQGLAHGRLRPANVRVTDGDRAVVVEPRLDAGRRPPSSEAWSHLAPEAVEGGPSFAADVYALGQILHELATGRPAFPAEGGLEHLLATKRATRALDPGRVVSLKLRDLVRRATALDPAERPPASEIVATFAEMAASRTPGPAPESGVSVHGGGGAVAEPAPSRSIEIRVDRTGREFRLLAELGRGGFGTVHLAELRTAHGLSRRVALKLLHADLDPASQGVARMRDEAQVLARLDHPVIVAVEDLAEFDLPPRASPSARQPLDSSSDSVGPGNQRFDGRIGLVVEYVEGLDLNVCIAERDPIPLRASLEVTSQVAAALDEAWRKLKLVHRDVKPANVRIGRHGTVKLLDFGIARSRVVARSSQTQANVLVGSFRYLAPERFVMEDEPEPPSDVFALGCVLYEAAAREALFEGLDILDLLRLTNDRAVLDGHVQARLAARPMPDAVRGLLAEMLAFEPSDRPSTAEVAVRCEQLAETIGETVGLRAWCRGHHWPAAVEGSSDGEAVSQTPPGQFRTTPPESPSQSTLARTAPPAPGRRIGLWVTLTAGSLGFGGLSLLGVLTLLVGLLVLIGVGVYAARPTAPPPVAPLEPVLAPLDPPTSSQPDPGVEAPAVEEPEPAGPSPRRRVSPRPSAPAAGPEEVPEVPEPAVAAGDVGPVVVRLKGAGFTAVQINCRGGYLRREALVNGVATVPDVPKGASCLCYFVGGEAFEPKKVSAGDTLACRVDRGLKCE